MNEISKEAVLKELKKVTDPEIKYSVVDLGYINKISIRKNKVKVLMVLTTPLCPYGGYIFQKVEEAVKKIKGVKEVEIEYDWDHPWSPEKVRPEIRRKLGI